MLQALQRLPARREITDSENSLLLRILIQSMVTVGIVATDVAAGSHMSLWAVPVSILGAAWSWRQRHRSQIAIKFVLAAAMLAALAYFLRNLFGNLHDTRLVLAELLVQIQAIHTFDMPKRKDLGYSLLIGLILIAVAATLSQTMAFAPLLLLFLTIGLPTLLLDYRSRLGLIPIGIGRKTFQGQAAPLPIRKLAMLLGTILSLGLLLFIAMPRLPGYQIESMPMSVDLPTASFTDQQISNPGYQNKSRNQSKKSPTKNGQGNNGRGGSSQNDDNTPAFDETSYYGFNQRIDQNLRGQLKPQVVMRVRSQSPGFWRVLAFDKYLGQGWEISQNDKAQKIQRLAWSNKFVLASRTFQMPRKKVIQSYTAVAELPNALPALTIPSEVFFPTPQIAVDREDSLRSPVGLSPDFTYTVVSQVPERRVNLLQAAGDRYGKSFQQVLPDYLQIPADLAQKLQPFTQKIIANYPLTQISKNPEPLTNNYDIALYLAQYLKQNYQVPTDPLSLPAIPPGQDLADWFLFRCQHATTACTAGGYPDHFATTYTMMLRSIGIPARLAVGFQPGYFNPFTGMYEVKNTDAHALTEVYFPEYGWYSFDPIPLHPLYPSSVEDDQTFGLLATAWKWVAGWLPSPVTAWLATIWAYIIRAIAMVWGWMMGSWVGVMVLLALAIAWSFGGWLLWKNWRRWRYQRWLKRQPPMEQLYQRFLLYCAETVPKQRSQTPLEHLATLQSYPAMLAIGQPVVTAYVAWRYGNQSPALEYLRSLFTKKL